MSPIVFKIAMLISFEPQVYEAIQIQANEENTTVEQLIQTAILKKVAKISSPVSGKIIELDRCSNG